MGILDELSSRVGSRSKAANKCVAASVLKEPGLIDEIGRGLESGNAKLAGDCAEVMTLVAAKQPELVVPHTSALIALLDHRDTRVRWEAMHSVAEIAHKVPEKVARIVPKLVEKIALDRSVIVRDYAILALGEYGSTSPAAARKALPLLREATVLWNGKHAGKALTAMQKLVEVDAALKPDVQRIAQRFVDHERAGVRKMAKKLARIRYPAKEVGNEQTNSGLAAGKG